MASSSDHPNAPLTPSAPPTFAPSQPMVPPQLLIPTPAPRRPARGLIISLGVGGVVVAVIVVVTVFLLSVRPSQGPVATWNITIDRAQATMGDSVAASALKPGDTYLVIDITAKNVSVGEQDFAGFVDFTVKDATGTIYQETYFPDALPPDGTIPAGAEKSGSIAFEVPLSQHAFTLIYDDPRYGHQQWQVNV